MKSLLFVGGLILTAAPALAVVGEEQILAAPGDAGAQVLVEGGKAVPIATSANDWPGVRRAAGDLQADVERVTGVKPVVFGDAKELAGTAARGAILVGTIGRSELIDGLVAGGKLNVDAIRGKWEAFVIEVVEKPLPGIDRALVIAGSDKRGTIYGIYDVSQQIGVSPWYWWADVPVTHRDSLAVKPGRHLHGSPSVKYRGIFLNDEAPDLTNWVRAKFGEVTTAANPNVIPGVANYGHEFYTKLFEVMLRLRANYLWPAMWNNAFNEDDPENARLADEYGIVMGTSHQEPMLRAQKEWDWRYSKTIGSWNYAKNPDVLENFWREGIRRNKNYESIVTMGLRGANDTEMAPGGPDANRALLEKIVDAQRQILREEVNPDITKVPQMWCLYKEVQEFYEHGMRVPDDVTLLWAEDNWGNIRRLPTAAERNRPGGAGIYYHFDYHGGPRSYQWLNTSPIPKIWEQMSLAKKYGADRIWIVNVGHFKGYGFPLEFFLDLAWDTDRWNGENLGDFGKQWATREFGPEFSEEIADIMAKYSKYNGRRKPEMLAPDTYSLIDYNEAFWRSNESLRLLGRVQAVANTLSEPRKLAFEQLVRWPVYASGLVNFLYYSAGQNALAARQGRASANEYAAQVGDLFQNYLKMVEKF
ncbi:MAG TPA: glycosyl hydrolase 115 family protein, partial [Candidatus Didemnitutus sp.]|nr:glycosyl hydrolase 115 family protein [Candidatus Didemnitutus sp.]